MATSPLYQAPSEGPRLSRRVVAGLGLGGLLILGGAVWLYASWPTAPPETRDEEAAPAVTPLPPELQAPRRGYAPLVVPERPAIPIAEVIARSAAPVAPVQTASIIPDVSVLQGQGAPAPQGQPAQQAQPMPPPPPTEKAAPAAKEPKYRKWDYQARGKTDPAQVAQPGPERKELAEMGQAQKLIKPANWAIPIEPLKTLYRSMLLPGQLLDAINSDIPASTIRILLTLPVFDKFGYDQIILDKGSLIIAKQEGKTEFGQARLPLKLEQVELPTGEVVDLKAMVSDEQGAAGVPGKVNNHTGKLLLATGINAVLNIGLRSASGTPGRGQFYENPVQGAAQDAGQSVAQDVNAYTRQQLKVPPTIEVRAGQAVTISLMENIQFHKKAVVVR